MSQVEVKKEVPDWALEFIEKSYWKFAKTMANIPHAYTIRTWDSTDKVLFARFIQLIQSHGYDQRFYSKTYRYYDVGEYKYWIMTDQLDEVVVLNRARRET